METSIKNYFNRIFGQMLLITCVVFAGLFLSACGKKEEDGDFLLEEDDKLVVYTSHKEEIYGPIVREFEDRTGIWVEVIAGGTNEMLDRIRQEKENPAGDIMFGGGVDSLQVYADCFEAYRSEKSDQLNDAYSSSTDSYTVFSRLPIVICYNSKLVNDASLPRSWVYILNDYWKGKIAFASPENSGSSYTAIESLIQILSEDYGLTEDEIMNRFLDNLDNDLLEKSGAVLDRVISGEKMIGICLEEAALKAMKTNPDLGILYPQEGTTALPDGTAIIKNARHMDNARLFLEFSVCEDVQKLLGDRMYRRSVRVENANGENFERFYDIDRSIADRQRILERFNYIKKETE